MTDVPHRLGAPGELVREYARRRGWPFSQFNIMVEGEHDQKYFYLASELYQRSSGRRLVGAQLAIFPPGIGGAGGTFGVQNDFPTLRGLVDADLSPDGERLFIVIALFDSDPRGKQAFRSLTARHARFVANRDVFLLQREYPRIQSDAVGLTKALERANAPWKALDCEIEDLIAVDLLNVFCEESGCAPRRRQSEGGRLHFDFEAQVKARLLRFVQVNAMAADMINVIEILKSLRLYLGLDPEGDLV